MACAMSKSLVAMPPMQLLTLHPSCPPSSIDQIHAECRPTEHGCMAKFRIFGPTEKLAIPALSDPKRQDNLWKQTCFEIFWQGEGGEAYCEFNLSPSTEWAAYRFDSHRTGGRDLPVETISISSGHDAESLMLVADVWADLPVPAHVGLAAVVEEGDTLRHFALTHPGGAPDFHAAASRTLQIRRETIA